MFSTVYHEYNYEKRIVSIPSRKPLAIKKKS